MSVILETIHRIVLPKYTIRIWRQERPDYKFEEKGYTEMELAAHRNQDLPLEELAYLMLDFEDISQVEVLGWNRNGVVLYKQWL